MASFKLHIARVRGCPAPAQVAKALKDFGLPEGEEFGVLNHSATDQSVLASLVRRTQQSVQRLNVQARELTAAQVERATVYPFGIKPQAEILEVYSGSASAIEQVGLFLAGALGLPTVVEPIELDLVSAIKKLSESCQRFQLRSLRVAEYAHSSYMVGPYTPRFMDSAHGMEFLEEYAEHATSAGVKFAGPGGRVTVSLGTTASFGFSCNEEDQPAIQMILRKLVIR